MKKVVGFVPAKGSSERTPSKNLQPILGIPLFLWAANNLSRVLPKEDIYIDSNSDEILNLAREHGFQAIRRPEDLATNATDGNKFMLWEVSNVEAEIYIQHLPPMPFLKKNTLTNALQEVKNGSHDSAVGVIREQLYLWKDGQPTYDKKNIPNSFTLPETIEECMGLYVTTRDSILTHKTRFGNTPYLQELDKFEAIDIDYPSDLELARAVAAGLGANTEYTSGIIGMNRRDDIRLLVLDIDGTMTDGGMYYTASGDELKKFNTKDGMAIKELTKRGVDVAFLSSGFTKTIIEHRAKMLGVKLVHIGTEPKMDILNRWAEELGLTLDQVAFVGDDINDLCAAETVGLFACPNDAVDAVKNKSHVVLDAEGGRGCVREFIDRYLLA